MKKIGIIALSAFLMLGCTAKPTPQDIFTRVETAREAITNADSYNMQIDMIMEMTIDEEVNEMVMTSELALDKSVSDNPQFKMNMHMAVEDQVMDITQYYKDGFVYMDLFGMKIKNELPYVNALAQVENLDSSDIGFNEAMYKNATLTKSGDDTIIKMSIEGDLLKEQSDALLKQFNILEEEGVSIQYKKVSVETTIGKEGYITNQTLIMPITMAIDEKGAELVLTIKSSYLNVSKPIDIEFPDFSEYTAA